MDGHARGIMKTTAIAFIAVTLLAVLAPPAAAGDVVVVQVTSIVASSSLGVREAPSDGSPVIDSRLSGIAGKLKALFAYKRYDFLGSLQAEAAFGSSMPMALPGRFTLEIEPEQFEPGRRGRIEMMVTLARDAQTGRQERGEGRSEREIFLRTNIRLENGGTVLLGGPPVEGGVLILALSARS